MTRHFPLELMHPFSEDFLREEAQKQDLTKEETKALIARFSCQDGKVTLPSKETVIEKILFISDKTLHARFTSIYKKFGLVGTRPGKFQELYRLLRNCYEQQGLSPRILQMPPLPGHFVERPQHQQAVKDLLLYQEPDTPGTLVISAIYGLGGIGKSVLAAALAHDPAVNARFPNGILWVTLGQNPDILLLLSGWVQALRDYEFKPISIEATTTHLRTLLYDKQMLLVVDDVWNSEHLEPFRVGRGQSRVLVTTRSAQIMDAQRYDLDVMTPQEALAMQTNQLGKELSLSEQKQALSFAKEVGYLPLALELAAAQVKHGATWENLLQEFQQEIVRLGALDLLSAEEVVEDVTHRKYSLVACFNLNLRQLAPEQLQQFAWLGVLPDDVTISREVAAVLWQVMESQAGVVLRKLRSKALLLTGVTRGNHRTYRMHDLVHDLAMRLLIAPVRPENKVDLPGLGLELAQAHQQFLKCYRTQRTVDGEQWHTLEDDGYIHRHLTWHMVQAQRSDAVHQLLQETTEQGQNGWFEACETAGQPAIFVSDIERGWKLAESLGNRKLSEVLVLLWRYTLIRASLNSLANNIPPKLIGALVEKGVWQPAQGLTYVKFIKKPETRAEGIKQIVSYLPEAFWPEVLEIAREFPSEAERCYSRYYSFHNDSHRIAHINDITRLSGSILSVLAPHMPELWPEILNIVSKIPGNDVLAATAPYLPVQLWPNLLALLSSRLNKGGKHDTLSGIIPYVPPQFLPEVLDIVLKIPSFYHSQRQVQESQVSLLTVLMAHLPEALLPKALEMTRNIPDRYYCLRALYICILAPHLPELWPEVLETLPQIQSEWQYNSILQRLVLHLPESLLPEALERIYQIQEPLNRTQSLGLLATRLPDLWPEVLENVQPTQIQEEKRWVDILQILAPNVPKSLLPKVLEIIQQMQSDRSRFNVLSILACQFPELWPEVLEMIFQIRDWDEFSTVSPLFGDLVPHIPERMMPRALEMAYKIPGGLNDLAPYLPKPLLIEALEKARQNISDTSCVHILSDLASLFPEYWSEALKMLRYIQSDWHCAYQLGKLVPHLPRKLIPEALEIARNIRDPKERIHALSHLTPYSSNLWPEILETIRQIPNKWQPANTLRNLIPHLPKTLIPEALEVTRKIKDERICVHLLNDLIPHLPKTLILEALEIAQQIKDKKEQVRTLCTSASYMPELWSEALKITRQIKDEKERTDVLGGTLARHLPKNLMSELLEMTRNIQSESSRAYAIVTLAPFLPRALMGEALEITRQIKKESDRARALNYLVHNLSNKLLKDALKIARQIQSEKERSRTLISLAHYMPELQLEALERISQIKEESSRIWALRDLLPHLPETLLPKVLEIMQQIEHQSYDSNNILRFLAPFFPELWHEILENSLKIHEIEARGGIIKAVIPDLPETLLPRALTITLQTCNHTYRTRILKVLIPRLPKTLVEKELKAEIRRIQPKSSNNPNVLAWHLEALTPYLSKALLKETVDITKQFKDYSDRLIVLRGVLGRLNSLDFKTVSNWSEIFKIFAFQKRKDVIHEVPKIKDTVLELAGGDTLIAMTQTMIEVCEQWP